MSNETYYSAFSYLEENDRQDVLAMIAVGGWIEGLNIILNLEPYSEESEICQTIADQKLTLENWSHVKFSETTKVCHGF